MNKMLNIRRLRTTAGLLVLMLISLMPSCTRELSEEDLKNASIPDLRFNPFGDTLSYAMNFTSSGTKSSFAILYEPGEVSMVKLGNSDASVIWKNSLREIGYGLDIKQVRPLRNGGAAIGFTSEQSGRSNSGIAVYDANGELRFSTNPGDDLFQQISGNRNSITGLEEDGNGGFYILIYLLRQDAEEHWLIHLNANRMVDQALPLNDDYEYLSSDGSGNLFMMAEISRIGYYPMELKVIRVDMDKLRDLNSVAPKWSYFFESQQADWKSWFYFPFKFQWAYDKLYIIKEHLLGRDDLCTGTDIVMLDPMNGSELAFHTLDFDFAINHWNNPSTMMYTFDENQVYLGVNFDHKSQVGIFSQNGLVEKFNMTSTVGYGFILGLGFVEDRLLIHGVTSMLRSPNSIPYSYFKVRP